MALAIEILIPGDRNFLVEDIDINSESFPRGSDMGLIPGLERSSGEGNGYLLQCSCLENSMDRETWWAIVHRVAKSQTRLKRLSTGMHKALHTTKINHRISIISQ